VERFMTSRKSRPLALVTGSSSGIGLELAKIFAAEGYNVVLTSEDREKLKLAADQVRRAAPDARIKSVVADLEKPAGRKKLYETAKGAGPIDIVVNNAGRGVWGEFLNTDLEDELGMIQLNVASVVTLSKFFARDMAKRGSGRMLFTASEASLSPIALMSVYAATKAFVYSFALSLREELKDSGVTVTALLPGATNTNFFNRAGMKNTKLVREDELADAREVARVGYDALMRGDDHVVYPIQERVTSTLAKLVPDRMAVQRIE
jgi:short-subunit dehydrogenase